MQRILVILAALLVGGALGAAGTSAARADRVIVWNYGWCVQAGTIDPSEFVWGPGVWINEADGGQHVINPANDGKWPFEGYYSCPRT